MDILLVNTLFPHSRICDRMDKTKRQTRMSLADTPRTAD
ncbi:hypothetical protein CLOBOL_03282 [Enterocloster bolteae ATCC BAA-613]|uniref:Uncharacterized protein n=1 Tax=Enterocloster bolteae (strain ATCC BAA-613 / DSM 15670 / CCUG 46953 / JCM 12243 / WAL 16351) TaxID=411902 RepID=A8RSD4_ENTBW|nr:hypothetical protein CLOBOL_03282 [Enterocloster bolteae ATCC BAA-613]